MRTTLLQCMTFFYLLIPFAASAIDLDSQRTMVPVSVSTSEPVGFILDPPGTFFSLRVDKKRVSVFVSAPGYRICGVEIALGSNPEISVYEKILSALSIDVPAGHTDFSLFIGKSELISGNSIRLDFPLLQSENAYGVFVGISTKDGSTLKQLFDKFQGSIDREALIASVQCKRG